MQDLIIKWMLKQARLPSPPLLTIARLQMQSAKRLSYSLSVQQKISEGVFMTLSRQTPCISGIQWQEAVYKSGYTLRRFLLLKWVSRTVPPRLLPFFPPPGRERGKVKFSAREKTRWPRHPLSKKPSFAATPPIA